MERRSYAATTHFLYCSPLPDGRNISHTDNAGSTVSVFLQLQEVLDRRVHVSTSCQKGPYIAFAVCEAHFGHALKLICISFFWWRSSCGAGGGGSSGSSVGSVGIVC